MKERRVRGAFIWFGYYAFDRKSWLHGICWVNRRKREPKKEE